MNRQRKRQTILSAGIIALFAVGVFATTPSADAAGDSLETIDPEIWDLTGQVMKPGPGYFPLGLFIWGELHCDESANPYTGPVCIIEGNRVRVHATGTIEQKCVYRARRAGGSKGYFDYTELPGPRSAEVEGWDVFDYEFSWGGDREFDPTLGLEVTRGSIEDLDCGDAEYVRRIKKVSIHARIDILAPYADDYTEEVIDSGDCYFYSHDDGAYGYCYI